MLAFLQHSGIASVNAGFGDSGGVYHSIYDSFDWYTHFSDKDFSRGRRSDANHVHRASPDGGRAGAAVRVQASRYRGSRISGRSQQQKELQLSELQAELGKLQTAAEAYETTYKKALDTPAVQPKLNRILIETERVLAP